MLNSPRFIQSLSVAIFLLVIAGIASATTKPTPAPIATASSTASSDSSSDASSVSSSFGGSSNANNQISYVDKDRLQAPSVSAPAVFASHSCAIGGSIGLAGPGFGVSGGKAKSDPKCDLRETVRILATLNPALALALLCQEDAAVAKAAGPDGCKLPPPAPLPPCQVCEPKDDSYSKEEVDERIERAFKSASSK